MIEETDLTPAAVERFWTDVQDGEGETLDRDSRHLTGHEGESLDLLDAKIVRVARRALRHQSAERDAAEAGEPGE